MINVLGHLLLLSNSGRPETLIIRPVGLRGHGCEGIGEGLVGHGGRLSSWRSVGSRAVSAGPGGVYLSLRRRPGALPAVTGSTLRA
jgi:hypothetical protein